MVTFSELSMTLSLRDYLLTKKVRDGKSLPFLYNTMQEDVEQWGIRLGNLFPESVIPCFPCIGITKSGLVDKYIGEGFVKYSYVYFLDVAVKVENSYKSIDRISTLVQLESLSDDLRILLVEPENCKDIPYYYYDSGGNKILPRQGSLIINQNPQPKITIIQNEDSSKISQIVSNFQVDVFLQL